MSEEKRKRILDLVRHDIFERGYSGLNMDDVSTRLGISKATLYKYFPGKHDIVKTALKDFKEEMVGKMRDIVNSRSSYLECHVQLIEHYKELLSTVKPFLLDDFKKNAPDILQELVELKRDSIYQILYDIFELGVNEKKVKDGIHPSILAFTWMHTMEMLQDGEAMKHFNITPTEMLNKLLLVFFTGVLTPSGEKELFKLDEFTVE